MKRSIILQVIVLITLLIACSEDKTVQQKIIRPVKYQKVKKANVYSTRTFSGRSKAARETSLSFRLNGVVDSIKVKAGEYIKKGDLIALLDVSDFQLKHEQTKSVLQNALVQFESSKANLTRVKTLYENDNVSLSQYENAKSHFAQAKSNLESSEKVESIHNIQLTYGKLAAPHSGLVAKINVEENELVAIGQEIVELYSEDKIEVEVGVPELFISKISQKDTVDVSFSSSERLTKGIISEISFSNRNHSTYPVTIKLLDNINNIRPGMSASVSFNFKSKSNEKFVIIPSNSILNEFEKNYVFIVKPTENDISTVVKREIKIGKLNNQGFTVLGGIEDGENIVTSGINKIYDGMTVKILTQ